ncbi:MFS transporter [Kitasatospora sp. NPDC002227]|uniref:MDR family MFS transporter n=1 Tax=Kitasatospora sp. NPDC002227 TaxID=3154773 RepID=UPI0033288EBA
MPASTPSTTGASGRVRAAVAETVGGLPAAFWWIFVSTLVNRLGGFVVTFLALYLTTVRGYSPSYAGLVAALFGLGSAVAALGAGVLTDRIGRRPTLLAAQLSNAVCTALLGFSSGQLTIAVVAFLCGLTNNASRPATSAIIADVVPPEHRVRAYSLNYWAINFGFGVSAAMAGLIAAHGFLALFLIDAATTLLCALVIFARIPETRPDAPVTATGDGAPQIGLGAVFRDTRFMALVGLNLVLALVAQQGSTTLAVDMGRAGLTTGQFGLVASLNGLLIVLLQLPVTRLIEHRGRTAMLVTAALLTGWGYGLTAFAGSSVAFFSFTVVVWTIGEIVYTPKVVSLVAELSPTHARGRYQGMFSLSWSLAAFAGPLVGGYLLQHLGSAVWWACAALGTVAAAGFVLLVRVRPAPGVSAPATATPAEVSA